MKRFILKKNSLGFTLIELLIVIVILGVLVAGVLVAIDPVDKINSANDSKVQNDISGAGRAAEAYATMHGGFYPATFGELVASGELKRQPAPPTGYAAYGFLGSPSPPQCTGGGNCIRVRIGGNLKSKKYTSTPVWNYDSNTGKSCLVATANIIEGNISNIGCP